MSFSIEDASKLISILGKLLAVTGSLAVMIQGLKMVSERMEANGNQGFGPSSLKAMGIVLFVPSLVILAVTIEDFKSEILAALLGTVAGYVLSTAKTDTTPKSPKKPALKKPESIK